MATATGKKQAWMSWSSGKDSAFALHQLRQANEVEVVGLLTTTSQAFDRVAMHGVRRALLQQQADALGLPLHVVELPSPCPNETYEQLMQATVKTAQEQGISAMAFGDLFLEDIRAYRERMLADTGITPLFPLWGRATAELAREMIAAGVVATISCLDPRRLPKALAGRRFDLELLAELPPDVDPCAEHGEFHTFASDGPMFSRAIAFELGEQVERDGFVFRDLVPLNQR